MDGLVAHDADGGGPDAPGDDDGTDGGDDADHRPEVLVPPNCGDGVVDPGEECDDGNRLNGDECDWACRTGSGEPPPAEPLDEVADSDTLGLVVTGSDIWASGPSRESLAENDERSPLVWTGEHCATVALIADLDDTPDIASDLQFIKFDRAGRLVGPGWRLHEPGRPFGQADLVANEDGFGLVWTNWADSTVWFVELDLDGKPLYSPVALADGSPALAVSLVWHDGTYGVFWVEGAVPITDENRDAVRFLAFGSRGIRRGEPIDVFRTGEPNLVLEIDSATSGDRHAVAFLAGPPPTYRVEHGAYVFSAVVTAGAELLATPMRIGPSAPGQAVAVAWSPQAW